MSLLNAWVMDRHAFIGVDTRSRREDGVEFPASKLFVVAQAGTVLAFSGSINFGIGCFCGAAMGAGGFDDIADGLTEKLTFAFNATMGRVETLAAMPADSPAAQQTVLVCGYSKRAGRLVGLHTQGGPLGWSEPLDIRGRVVLDMCMFDPGETPAQAMVNRARQIGGAEAMRELLASQVQRATAHPERLGEGGFVGGNGIVAELRALGEGHSEIKVRDMGPLQ